MNTKNFTRCWSLSQYKRHLFQKSLSSHFNTKNYKNISSCMCSMTLTPNLTSNNYNKNISINNTPRRFCSTNRNSPAKRLPPLMTFPEIVWPSLIKSFRNFILTTFIIKPYFDREFNIPDFIAGSKAAVEVVSSKLSEGDMHALDGLVDKTVVPDLQRAVSQMSLSQRQQILINKDDIYFSFPYQIGIMFDDENSTAEKRFVEITMVYHSFRGLEGIKNRGEELPLNVGMFPQYRDNISICNYRFIREFTKGVEGEWTINLLNHFKPSDYIDQ